MIPLQLSHKNLLDFSEQDFANRPKVGVNFLYLCVVISLYARKVISYAISEDIDTKLTAKAFDHAFISRGQPEKLLFHSDQGAQYTAFSFQMHLKAYGVQQSFSAPVNPDDNEVAESFLPLSF